VVAVLDFLTEELADGARVVRPPGLDVRV
jgi:hypothetical protein